MRESIMKKRLIFQVLSKPMHDSDGEQRNIRRSIIYDALDQYFSNMPLDTLVELTTLTKENTRERF